MQALTSLPAPIDRLALNGHGLEVRLGNLGQGMGLCRSVAGIEDGTLLGRMPTLAEVANVATFVASDRASVMTGTVANMSCGSVVD
jgi:NAD(P)-dependent dehydrogenase (short-subunit alcohol dehydrogenase family)